MATQLNPGTAMGLTGIARRIVIDGALSEDETKRAVEASTRQKIPLLAFLVQSGQLTMSRAADVASHEFGTPIFDIRALDLKTAPVKLVAENLIQQHKALPLFKRGNRLFVGLTDPTNLRALDEIKFQTNLSVDPIIIPEDMLERAIEQALAGADSL